MLMYLDIDGVMVPAQSWKQPEILDDGFPAFSSRAVCSLKKILSSTSAHIVLTTSHKWQYSLEQWKAMFDKRDITVDSLSRLPKNTVGNNRKEELINWFSSQADLSTETFLIIDDDKSLNALPELYKSRLIQPSATVGLTESLAIEALKLA